MGTNRLFKRDFTLVVIGQIISLFGNAILRFALPLYLLRETGSSTLFGAVTACSFIPMIVLSLVGGVLADRVNKRNIMVALDFVTAGLITGFYLLLGEMPVTPLLIVTLMILYGVSGTYQPAVQASIPVLVPEERLLEGNAAINMVSTLSGLLGPVIGGILFSAWGLRPILVISVACFTFSAVMEIFIRIPHQKKMSEAGLFSIVRGDIRESWHFVKYEKPVFIPVVFILAAFNLVLSASMIVGIPVMVVNVLELSDTYLGFTQGALGLGGLAGGVMSGIASKKLRLRHSGLLLLACSASAAIMGLALLPFVPPMAGYYMITVMAFMTMVVSTLFTVRLLTVVQLQTPPGLVGKVIAVMIAISGCAQPLGQAIYGLLFDLCAAFPYIVMLAAAAAGFIISLYSKQAFWRLESEN